MRLREARSVLGHLLRHPLNRRRRLAALAGFLRWQVGSRILPGGVVVPFVGGTRLLVEVGMTGATGNVYCGLHEFADMGLVLHALRPGDLFVDVGANVGSYTILAAGASGASVLSVEPIPSTFAHLLDNVRLNDLGRLVTACNIGLGARPGRLRFSTNLGTVNHVITEGEGAESDVVEIPVETLDGLLAGSTPHFIKIDVEGFEGEVLRGAVDTLASPRLLGMLIELDGNGARYGFDEDVIYRDMVERGFTACRYDPLRRELAPRGDAGRLRGNTLFVRDVPGLSARVRSAPRRRIHGVDV